MDKVKVTGKVLSYHGILGEHHEKNFNECEVANKILDILKSHGYSESFIKNELMYKVVTNCDVSEVGKVVKKMIKNGAYEVEIRVD